MHQKQPAAKVAVSRFAMLLSLSKLYPLRSFQIVRMEKQNLNVVGDASKARFISAIVDNVLAILLTVSVVGLAPENSSGLRLVLLVSTYLGYYFMQEAIWARTVGKLFQGLI